MSPILSNNLPINLNYPMTDSTKNKKIEVLELRNYLLKPNVLYEFEDYFNTHFVEPMSALGGYTLGQYHPENDLDRFVWLRGFSDMNTRGKFLRDFYVDSPVWKEYGPGANSMMINSDNVHLLRPLSDSIYSDFLGNDTEILEIEYFVCNSTLTKVIELFESSYIPYLNKNNVFPTLWVSEMQENDFPRLPVFQDHNLLVTITPYKNEEEYRKKQQLKDLDGDLRTRMLELITSQSKIKLTGFRPNSENRKESSIPEVQFDKDGNLKITASPTSSKHDFDFLNGKHVVHHKKLKERLSNNNEWFEFDGNHQQELFLNGMANLEQQTMVDPEKNPVEGAAIRLFDPQTKLWSIYWADSNTGKFDPPVQGSFENGLAYFLTRDQFRGRDILVAFRWDARDPDKPVWSQAFSDDNGKSWEWNWYMYFTKVD